MKKDDGGPIYVINLFISNLIQLGYKIDLLSVQPYIDVLYINVGLHSLHFPPFSSVYICSLMARIHFVVCVALDR